MDQKINKILKDIYQIAPKLLEKEKDLKKTIEKLLIKMPESDPDPQFKKELLEKILKKYGKPEAGKFLKKAFYLRPSFIALMAASLLIVFVGVNIYLPKDANKSNSIKEHTNMPHLKTNKNIRAIDEVKVPEVPSAQRGAKKKSNTKREDLKLIAPLEIPGEIVEDSFEFEVGIEGGIGDDNISGSILCGSMIDSQPEVNTESYKKTEENTFVDSMQRPLSTFSIDVDTASYSNMRRFLMERTQPPQDAIRVEELINYFPYNYPKPDNNDPFSINTEFSICPWNKAHNLVLIGLKGREIEDNKLPPSNLVFLIDVSGSMDNPDKLPLLLKSFKLLSNELKENDRISIVVYAGSAGLVLPPTSGNKKDTIYNALNKLQAGGSTAGGQGIRLAYRIAEQNFIEDGNNRVILATDGDFNVGQSSDADMERLIEKKRNKGVFLTVLGFGMGNYKDSKMEILADKGNGNYFYIDSLMEANKVLVNDLRKTMFTIAKDVKIQVEFNPAKIKSYKLIGYENRSLKKEDFANDKKDAGEIGSGHTVTALYEIVLRKKGEELKDENGLKYQKKQIKSEALNSHEMMTVKLRHKKPDENKSSLISRVINQNITTLDETSNNFRFASSVAEFGLLLRNSKYKKNASFSSVLNRAKNAMGTDKFGYRKEFLKLVKIAADISKKK